MGRGQRQAQRAAAAVGSATVGRTDAAVTDKREHYGEPGVHLKVKGSGVFIREFFRPSRDPNNPPPRYKLRDGHVVEVGTRYDRKDNPNNPLYVPKGKQRQEAAVGWRLPRAVDMLPPKVVEKQGNTWGLQFEKDFANETHTAYYNPATGQAFCDCAKAKDGGICPHQLAAMLFVENQLGPEDTSIVCPYDQSTATELHQQLQEYYDKYLLTYSWEDNIRLCDAFYAYGNNVLDKREFTFADRDIAFPLSEASPEEEAKAAAKKEARKAKKAAAGELFKVVEENGVKMYVCPPKNGWPEVSFPTEDQAQLREAPPDENPMIAYKEAPDNQFIMTDIMRDLAAKIAARRTSGSRSIGLFGPPGTGKSEFPRRMAQCLDMPLFTVSCSRDTDVQALMGGTALRGADGVTNTVSVMGPLAVAATVKGGSIIVLDEFDQLSESGQAFLHRFIQDGTVEIQTSEGEGGKKLVLQCDPNTQIFVTWNPRRGKPDEPLLSRLAPIEVPPPDSKDMARLLARDLDSNPDIKTLYGDELDGHSFSPEKLRFIADFFYGVSPQNRNGSLFKASEEAVGANAHLIDHAPTPREAKVFARMLVLLGEEAALTALIDMFAGGRNQAQREQSKQYLTDLFNNAIKNKAQRVGLPKGLAKMS